MPGPGMLEKLTILAFDTPNYVGAFKGEFHAYVNPAEVTTSWEMEYDNQQGVGTTNSRMDFKRAKPGDLVLSFFLDATGADGDPAVPVQERVEKFKDVTGYNGQIHRSNYLTVIWGTLPVRRCVLKSASITYKLFNANGIPLRAVINATFIDNSDDQTRVAEAQDKSADLTHVRVVHGGDSLPLLCHRIYGDPRRYIEVALENGLTNFALAPGTTLVFPPLARRN